MFHKAPVFPSSACFGFSVFAQLKVVFDMDCAFGIDVFKWNLAMRLP